MKILVIGASGKTGQCLLKKLSTTNHDVSGMVRNDAQFEMIDTFNATPVLGDLEKDLTDIFNGFQAIFFVAGSRGKNVEDVDYQGLVNAVKAAEGNHIKRFIYLSSLNIGKKSKQIVDETYQFYKSINERPSEGLIKAEKNPKYIYYLKMKEKAEQRLIDSSLDYTVFRAGLLTLDSGSGKIQLTEGNLNAFGKISRDNVSDCFIMALNDSAFFNKIYTILDGNTPIAQLFKGTSL